MNNLQLTDNTISHIAQLLQIAILTGTDVVDNLRSARFVTVEEKIEVSPEYLETFQANLSRLLEEADQMSKDSNEKNESE
jgi:hypothetical protein